MKKSLSIFLLSLYLFTTFQVGEYIKLPFLVIHFNEHQQENPNLNLFQFLSMHYTTIDVIDDDYDKDMKLPFKSHSINCNCATIILCTPVFNYNFSQKSLYLECQKPNFGYNVVFIPKFHSKIWQPPKIC